MTNSIDFIIDKSSVSDKTKIANGFNDYCVNVGSSLSSNIYCNVNPLSYVEANPNSMVTPSLTVGDIINVISSLNNSSSGYDEMPASILKKCIDDYITQNSELRILFDIIHEQLIETNSVGSLLL